MNDSVEWGFIVFQRSDCMNTRFRIVKCDYLFCIQ